MSGAGLTPPDETIWHRLGVAAMVAMAGFAAGVPYLYYMTYVAFGDVVRARFGGIEPSYVLQTDTLLVAIVAALSALIGALLSRRYGLPGLGDRDRWQRALRRWSVVALLAGALMYVGFGRDLAARIPGYYPSTLGWAGIALVKSAVFDEIVARYGMLTIARGVTRRELVANLLQATFFTATLFKGLGFFGIAASWDLVFVVGLACTFLLHLGFGWVQGRYGLFATVSLRGILELRHLLHAAVT